jgi:hypothetical protein
MDNHTAGVDLDKLLTDEELADPAYMRAYVAELHVTIGELSRQAAPEAPADAEIIDVLWDASGRGWKPDPLPTATDKIGYVYEYRQLIAAFRTLLSRVATAPAAQQAGAAKLDLTNYSQAINYANDTTTTVIQPAATTASTATCTCPSGDGSLRWPCPQHPPEATTASASGESAAFENYFCMTLSCNGSESQELIDACHAAAHDAWMERARRAQAPSRDAAPLSFDAWWITPNPTTGHPPGATLDHYSARKAWDAAELAGLFARNAALAQQGASQARSRENAKAVQVFTCIGKGGEYEVIGYSNGAGPKRGESIVVYYDVTKPDILYHRSADDFKVRMQWQGTRASHASNAGEGDEKLLADSLNMMMWLYRRLPVAYGKPPFVDAAIMKLGERLGCDDVPIAIRERAAIAASAKEKK